MKFRNKVLLTIGIVCAILFSSVAYASVPDSNGVIHGCRNNILHTITVRDDASQPKCPAGTTSLDWNQTGPAGPQGPKGDKGEVATTGTVTTEGPYSYPGALSTAGGEFEMNLACSDPVRHEAVNATYSFGYLTTGYTAFPVDIVDYFSYNPDLVRSPGVPWRNEWALHIKYASIAGFPAPALQFFVVITCRVR